LNKKLLFLSFGIAVLLWFYVLNSRTYTMTKEIPLTFKKPEGMSISALSTEKIKIKLKGTKFFLKQIDDYDPRILIDLISKKVKRINVSIAPRKIPVPFGIELVEYSPQNILISLSKTRSKLIPIEAKFIGELRPGLLIKKVGYNPSKIRVFGAWENLKKLDKVSTSPIDLEKVLISKTFSKPILLSNPRYYFNESFKTEITLNIGHEKKAQRLKDIAFKAPKTFKILGEHSSMTLDVLVPNDYLLKQEQIRTKLITPQGKKGALNAKVEVELPKGVELLRIYPEYIKVFVPQL